MNHTIWSRAVNKSNKERRNESERLIKLGFNQFKNINVINMDTVIDDIPVWGGKKKIVSIYSKEKINITVPKRLKKNLKFSIKYKTPIIAPIKKDQKIAEFLIKKNNEILKKYDLFSNEEVPKLNFLGKVFQNLKYLILGETLLNK